MRRDLAARNFAAHDFLYRYVADELFDRLGDVTRQFTRALLIGCPDEYMRDGLAAKGIKVVCADPGFANARKMKGVQDDEEALAFSDASFYLSIACGTLERGNDLPWGRI